MQHTTCTEDRIQHALERCLDGLCAGDSLSQSWSAGLCMNRWSLEELVKRDAENFLILLQQILRKTREVQDGCLHELVTPLAIMFSYTILQTPHIPADSQLLVEAYEVFHSFLTWPEPYCTVCRDLLSVLCQEMKSPGISFHRLVKQEQGLVTSNHKSKTITVLLMNPVDVPPEFLSVSEQLSQAHVSQKEAYIALIKHAFQATLGTKYSLHCIQKALQLKSVEELREIFSVVTELLETAASMEEADKGRTFVVQGLEGLREKLGLHLLNGKRSDGLLQILPLPTATCYMYKWEKDNFDILNNILEAEQELVLQNPTGEEQVDDNEDEEEQDEDDLEEEDEEVEVVGNGCIDHRASTISTMSTLSTVSKDSMLSSISVMSNCSAPSVLSMASGVDSDFCEDPEDSPPERGTKPKTRLSQRFSMLFRTRSSNSLSRAKSLGSPETKDFVVVRSKRSNSLPQHTQLRVPGRPILKPFCFRRRPILSCDEDSKPATLRVVVFGADHAAGKVARAYSSLRLKESTCPHLTRVFKLQFFFVPVRRSTSGIAPGCPSPRRMSETPLMGNACTEPGSLVLEDSTNDISRFIGMLDPWYERNMLSLLKLPVDVLCQQTSKAESELCSSGERLSILADLVLYYCRNAGRTVLVQLYQAELTLAGGDKRKEVFVHSLELGHTAGTRAVKALGAASKRFGIDGDREAVPLTLEVIYNKVGVSGRSQWNRTDKVCTSINLTKACRRPEELDSKMECLQLTMTEVLKRQNSKSKKGYNQQLSITEVKVDKVQVCGANNITFAVCLDQDEKKIIQSVTRCEVTVCYKPDSMADRRFRKAVSAQAPPLHPTFCSLLCLPIATFGGVQP